MKIVDPGTAKTDAPRPAERRVNDAGYARGDKTREQMVRAALDVFTDRGYEGASIRALAVASGSRHAAIQYYFGGKEGLFRACTEFLCDATLENLSGPLALLEAISLDSEASILIDGMIAFTASFLGQSGNPQVQTNAPLFLAREQSLPGSPAFQIICERLHRPLTERLAVVVGAILGQDPAGEQTLIRTSSIIASMFGQRAQLPVTLYLLGWDDVSGDREALWGRVVRAHLRGVLESRL